MRFNSRFAWLLSILVFLGGCASKPDQPAVMIGLAGQPAGRIVTVFVATTRSVKEQTSSVTYTADKSFSLTYSRFRVAVPAAKAGKIDYSLSGFSVVERKPLTRSEFLEEIAARASTKGQAAMPSIGIYVHGFNNNFPESLYRLAQMKEASGSDAVPVLFSWPSVGTVAGYGADRDSVTYSRDYLADLLLDTTNGRRRGDVVLLGHSMGAYLATEAVRQLKIARHDTALHPLQLVLAAPDIDEEVFRQQMRTIGKLPIAPVILVTKDDRALDISRLLATDRPRLGSLSVDSAVVRRQAVQEGVQIIDISERTSIDPLNHDRYEGLAPLYRELMARRVGEGKLTEPGSFQLTGGAAVIPASTE
ncbi:Esterase/lipase superfamily enzyme [Rhizobium sp. NFR07]|uniref:alpha/beta hydrolase n=1 Tax=Rhizobium sp. NFR07 TaxID=1566262 RepID=UPI0008DFEA4E|nr:alpha/beta fold hydrolase [Rhizobium sp. NFR07]SFB61672.1 Esterase/lipase superfamily enzyme [Rhizobium sp. NFR07]